MNQTERIADGKRRFFAARGEVHDVLVRARKGHNDIALEKGRDYEIEPGGVALAKAPAPGVVITILTGDRVREDGGPGATPAAPSGTSEPIVDRFAVRLPVPGAPDYSSSGGSAFPAAAGYIPTPSPPAAQPASHRPIGGYTPGKQPVNVADQAPISPAPLVGPPDMPGPPVTTYSPLDLERIKQALFASIQETNNEYAERTAQWQDGLAMLTAMMLAAPDWDATRAAMLEVEGYIRG